MRMLAVSFALSHKMEVTCDAPLAATAPFRRRPEHEVNERQGEGGSQAEVPARPRYVRFSLESRGSPKRAGCPLGARKRHMQCSKLRAAGEIQPTLQLGLRGMKCGFGRRATAGRRLIVPSPLS